MDFYTSSLGALDFCLLFVAIRFSRKLLSSETTVKRNMTELKHKNPKMGA
jgi:hypothetical protein